MLEIFLMIKSLEKLGIRMNPMSMGIQIHSRFQILVNMELLVLNCFYHTKNMFETRMLSYLQG